jgi:Na+/proline symporter
MNFGLTNWLIVLVPVLGILAVSVYCRRYIRDVVDYLSAGRVARRYLLCVGGMEETLGVVTLISYMEVHYMTGFSVAFWQTTNIMVGMFLGLSGWCLYRFRETRAMTMGQFLEMRYNRILRVFASILRVAADILTELFLPAIAARFFIYFFDLPFRYTVFGVTFSTYASLMALTMSIALFIIFAGGSVALLVTDCMQGILCYPMFMMIVLFALFKFSWSNDIVPVMFDRVQGESFMNPFDISHMRDFNIFMLTTGILKRILNRAVWISGGSQTSAKNAHEQKMAGVLGTWRTGFATLMQVLIAIMLIVMLNHKNFSGVAQRTRLKLCSKTAEEVMPELRREFEANVAAIGEQKNNIDVDPRLSQRQNLDTAYFDVAESTVTQAAGGNIKVQKFRTLYYQQLMPMTMRHLLPKWMLGLFALLIVMIMISTDNSKIFIISTAMAQDLVLPFLKKPMQTKHQLWLIRWLSVLTAVILYLGSYYVTQMEYLSLFIAAVASLWVSGAGSVMCFGLYSRFGTTAGAFTALIVGSGVSCLGFMCTRYWPDCIYPWLEARGMVDQVGNLMFEISRPLHPYVLWQMNPHKFPINAYEISFIAILFSCLGYVIVSLCQTLRITLHPFRISWREDRLFNLEKLLHRGKYADDKSKVITTKWTLRNTFSKLIGITPEYTKGDRAIAYGVFFYTFIYRFLGTFALVLLFNWLSPWGKRGWSNYYLVTILLVPFCVALISTFWFMIGGICDLRHLFIDLEARKRDFSDDGRVEKDK